MKIIACIPARENSTRLPKKLLLPLGDKSVIANTFLNTKATNLFTEVIVITDSNAIETEIKNYNGKVLKSTKEHETGTDRIAAFATTFDADIIINIQGDEPFVNKKILANLIESINTNNVDIASVQMPINEQEAQNPNFVKVVCNSNSNALLFSRSPIPYPRNKNEKIEYFKHIGIYAFKKQVLLDWPNLIVPEIEKIEMLENLRMLYNGYKIKMITTNEQPIGIDTLEDLEKARLVLENNKYK
jgi:3-deoxy-manno-octulosonate cytidylyltransferase (CMP-KDO synthetase)